MKILVTALLENSLTTMENYDLYQMFSEEGFDSKHRMAWVDLNPEPLESTKLAETILANRGIVPALFQDTDNAKEWLMEE